MSIKIEKEFFTAVNVDVESLANERSSDTKILVSKGTSFILNPRKKVIVRTKMEGIFSSRLVIEIYENWILVARFSSPSLNVKDDVIMDVETSIVYKDEKIEFNKGELTTEALKMFDN